MESQSPKQKNMNAFALSRMSQQINPSTPKGAVVLLMLFQASTIVLIEMIEYEYKKQILKANAETVNTMKIQLDVERQMNKEIYTILENQEQLNNAFGRMGYKYVKDIKAQNEKLDEILEATKQ